MALDRSFDQPHRVGKARFELAGTDEATILATRGRIAEAAEAALPAALAGVFDEAVGPDEVLEIDRLEVDLGSLDAGALDLEILAGATRRALARIAPPSPRTSPDGAEEAAPPHRAEPERGARRRPLGVAAIDALIVYLRTGRLDLHSPQPSLELLLDALEPSPETAARLLAAIRATPLSVRRAAIMRLITTAPSSLVAAIMTADNADALAAQGGSQAFEREVDAARRSEVALAAFAARLIEAVSAGVDLPEAGAEAVPPEQRPQPTVHMPTAAADAESALAAPNAGVVLLHPFLPRLFELCGLIVARRFRIAAARIAAARLVHYLATGESEAAEPEHVIPSLLCAVPPELPVLGVEPLEPALLERADALLLAAIGHWSRLGNTSPAGLRETFLTRPGLLKGPPERPRIVVEQRGVDVLIRSLPWAIDPIRLPWLPAPIAVDWT